MFKNFFGFAGLRLWLDATSAGAGDGNGGDPQGQDPEVPDWDTFLATLPEDLRPRLVAVYEKHNQGLLNTVKAVRGERDTFAAQVRAAAGKLEKDSAAQQELLKTAAQLEEANRRADFMEDATSQGCNNPKVAWVFATNSNLFDTKGKPQWDALKSAAPQLFGTADPKKPKPKGKGAAGEGTSDQPNATSVTQFIRKAAGSRTIST